jgi:uncharacterized protein YecT (DUF1311 family)
LREKRIANGEYESKSKRRAEGSEARSTKEGSAEGKTYGSTGKQQEEGQEADTRHEQAVRLAEKVRDGARWGFLPRLLPFGGILVTVTIRKPGRAMRMIFWTAVVATAVGVGTAGAQHAGRVLTEKQRTPLRNQALAALEDMKEDAKDCPIKAEQPMVEYRACLGKNVIKAEGDFKTFMTAIRTLLVTPKPEEVNDTGMQRWYADNQRDFDAAAAAWTTYYHAECKAETTLVEPGSGMPERQAECQFALLTERAQRVRDVYGEIVGLNGYK